MKACSKCGLTKPYAEFWRKTGRRGDGYQPWCKKCSTARRAEYLADNREREYALRDEWNRRYRAWYVSLKEDKPCSRCEGLFFHAAMHWHHPNDDKEANVADMARHRRPKDLVLKEIAKCELVCSNCHAELTWDGEVV